MSEEKNIEKNENSSKKEKEEIKYLSGMYKDWFLDYASYVILDRAVPYVDDGLKPVQRRILHAMKQMDDGRYNKAANIIGQTMQYHPHGDQSIGAAMIQLGQKGLLIDTQGNWGNILTGDSAAAPRYIEARPSKFALEVLYNPKTTEWKLSYDGRKNEPIALPVKFPLLLAQGVEGIAVGLASKIFPHNFVELIDASIAYLKNEEFEILPDFPTGGMADFSKYNDGLRGGSIKVRAKIEKKDNKTLVITELPFGKTTSTLIDSIIRANERGKIKIKKIDDNTAQNVEILVYLAPKVSSDKTIDALYAFTDCEISLSPNACIIKDERPHFIGVSKILKISTDNTLNLLKKELEIRKSELENSWHSSSLEKIFIEERIYKDKGFENAKNMDVAIDHIDKRLEPFKDQFIKEITRDDILKLMEIKMARILKFNKFKADEHIKNIEKEIEEVKKNIKNIVSYTINWFEYLKDKYGKEHARKTEIRNFENIVATKVVVRNEKLYLDRREGFVGTGLKKAEYISDCSDIDDIIIFRRDGTYFVTKVSDKAFIGKNPLHVAIFKKRDKRTIYNVAYRDGKNGYTYVKRFFVSSITRDKEYDLTRGNKGSRVTYFSANPNGEAETIKVVLKPKPRIRKLIFEEDFSELAIKGRQAIGNILTKHDIHKIILKEKGVSTLGGRKIWFDKDVMRLNVDKRGDYLGEFSGEDKIFVIYKTGELQLYGYDLSTHFDPNILSIQKYEENKILSVVYFDADINYYYIKRFELEYIDGKKIPFIGDNPNNKLITLTWNKQPEVVITFGGKNEDREDEVINVEEFIGIKSYRAKGKRLSNYEIDTVEFLEKEDEDIEEDSGDTSSEEDIPFEINRPKNNDDQDDEQMSLF